MSKFLRALEQSQHDQALRASGSARITSSRIRPPDPNTPLSGAPPFLESPTTALLSTRMAPNVSEELDEHLVSLVTPSSFEAEQYRALRYQIEMRHKSRRRCVVAVSSPGASDGKTTTAINLAGALAQAPDARVLLVDVDLRQAAMADRLGLPDAGQPGLVDVILDPALSLIGVVHTLRHLNLSVIAAGRLPASPYELLKSPRLGELFAEARQRFDYIILDTPPLVSVPDCRVIGKWVDGFLIVVTAHRTPRKLLEEALKIMDPTTIIGLVFNADDRHLSRNAYPMRRTVSSVRDIRP
jgi:protein-tyrosine kinase